MSFKFNYLWNTNLEQLAPVEYLTTKNFKRKYINNDCMAFLAAYNTLVNTLLVMTLKLSQAIKI